MKTQTWNRVGELFAAAADCETRQQQLIMDRARGDDPVLASAVQRLLDADGRGTLDVFDATATRRTGRAPLAPLAQEFSPETAAIPGYLVLRKLGHGGQASVYLARQESAGHRPVALKIMRSGPTPHAQRRRRFEREVEVVSSLSHPNIVPLFDSGQVAGHFYFVMQYVAGASLTDHVRSNRLDVRQTLQLFQLVCDAVDYAHQRGVIHRDLKPSNILVDEQGNPQILDFGLAKILDADNRTAPPTELSFTGQVLGTLAYMAPEQAAGRVDEIDMRSDVYSLGVMLYELLTRSLPYPVDRPIFDVLHNIQAVDPQPPRRVRTDLDDEIETILLRALSKDKNRRYATAGLFGRDIRRYLDGEPIDAKRDSEWYRLRKQLRRYRLTAGIVSAFVLVVVVALACSVTFWRQAAQRASVLTQESFVDALALAESAYASGNFAAMDVRLDSCPEELRGWEWLHLRRRYDGSLRTHAGHNAKVMSLDVSPDGRRIASGGFSNTIRVVDATSGRLLAACVGHKRLVSSVDFDTGGRTILSGSWDRTVRMWNAETGESLRTFRGHKGAVFAARYVGDGRLIVSCGSDNTIRVWDVETARNIHTADLDGRTSTSLAVDANGSSCVVAMRDGRLELRRLPTAEVIWVEPAHESDIFGVTVSPNGRLIASAGHDGTIQLRRMQDGSLLRRLSGHSAAVTSVAFDACGTRILSVGHDRTLRAWDVRSGDLLQTLGGHDHVISSIALGPNGTPVVTGSWDGTVKQWDVSKQPAVIALAGHEGPVLCAAISADGRRIVSGGADKRLILWDADAGRELSRVNAHHTAVRTVAFSHDDRSIISAGDDQAVKMWDSATLQCVDASHEEHLSVRALGIHPSRTLVAAVGVVRASGADFDSALRIRSAPSGALHATNRDYSAGLHSVAFHPSGERLVTGGDDDAIRLWDAASGALLKTMRGHSGLVKSCAFSRDGRWIASGSNDMTARIWDAETGNERIVVSSHASRVSGVVFTQDGKRLVTADDQGIITIWGLPQGRELLSIDAHDGAIHALAFSQDERRLLSAGSDGLVKVWGAMARDRRR